MTVRRSAVTVSGSSVSFDNDTQRPGAPRLPLHIWMQAASDGAPQNTKNLFSLLTKES